MQSTEIFNERRLELFGILSQLPEHVRMASGSVLSSGLSALTYGPAYASGMNPGGDPGHQDHRKQTLLESVAPIPDVWSSYVSDLWDKGRQPGDRPHQQRVARMIREGIGCEPSSVFSANAISVRTKVANDLFDPWALWREHFWPLHQWFLGIVRPKVILALGNGNGLSAFGLFLDRASEAEREPTTNFRSGKFARARFDLPTGPISVLLIGAPHPSRFPVAEDVIRRLQMELTTDKARAA
jgi:hypothetical protein